MAASPIAAPPPELVLSRGEASTVQKGMIAVLNFIDRTVPWHKWPVPIAAILLVLRRTTLKINLIDVPQPAHTPLAERLARDGATIADPDLPKYRTEDGFGNDGQHPGHGANGATIGRNMGYVKESERMLSTDPSPQYVAQKLLARRDATTADGSGSAFKPAGMQLNVLAAAWIQAMIHDWQDHTLEEEFSRVLDKGAQHGCPMAKFKFQPTLNADTNGGTAYLNKRTGWWDASFVYGQDPAAVDAGREKVGGRVKLADGMLPVNEDGSVSSGDQHNSWAGVTVLQVLFAKEHNRIADEISADDPSLSDEAVFQLTRLAVSAIVAKVHTVDWTVELLKTPTLRLGMRGNWYGLFGLGPLGLGLVGSKKADNHGVPFSLTEEFTAVYRLHPLLPDSIPLTGVKDPIELEGLVGTNGYSALVQHGVNNFLESTMKYPCGALTLFNYPKGLRSLPITDDSGVAIADSEVDLAALDIFRDRERGIPRYNQFRRQLNMNPIKDWKELTGDDPVMIAALTEVYGDDIERCDLLVGNLAEKKIPGFAISETSFIIFLVMASRRLEADRFLTEDFNEKTYGKVGFAAVTRCEGLRDLVAFHYPELEKDLPPGESAFKPYQPMPAAAGNTQ